MKKVLKKIKTLLSIDPKWAYRFLRKRAVHRLTFWRSILLGRKYWEADVDGVRLRLAFFTPYHHRIAYFMHEGGFEHAVLASWKEASAKAAVIYDIGGFNGMFGLLAAKVHPNAKVVIFEPDATSARHIRENIKINDLKNCELREVAVAEKNGTAKFTQYGSTGEHFDEHGQEVRVEALDSLPPANLIKIDVEGAEAKVIAGGLRAFAQTKPTMFLELHPWLDKTQEETMWRSLKELGYSWKLIGGEADGNPHYLVS